MFQTDQKYHNNLLVCYFKMEKTQELIAWKYYEPILWQDIEAYIKICDMCFALKAVKYKAYNDL